METLIMMRLNGHIKHSILVRLFKKGYVPDDIGEWINKHFTPGEIPNIRVSKEPFRKRLKFYTKDTFAYMVI